jgi:hypothetical protein
MSATVYRITTMLSSVLHGVPVGTNLGLFHLLWTLLSGRLLASRGAIIPALADTGLPTPAVRRAWAALARGHWQVNALLARWQQLVQQEGQWQPRVHGGYRPVVADLVGFFRPRLQDCPTRHYSSAAGKALPAIPLGMLARIGTVGSQRLPLPVRLLRAAPADPSEAALQQQLVHEAAALLDREEVLLVDGGFPLSLLLAVGVPRFVVRLPKNFTARRATLPPYRGYGRPPEYGELVRPLARHYKEQRLPATPPDREEPFLVDDYVVRVQYWDQLVLAAAKPGAPSFTCLVIHDPRYREPLVLATPLAARGTVIYALYRDRWPIEQWPLSGKQMLGAVRQFVFAPESRQRLPELALLAGAIVSYVAATEPARPTGFWDRRPQATAGRLRRALARVDFQELGPLPDPFRKKATPTAHLPKGVLGHRRRKRTVSGEEALPLAA